MVSSTNAQRAWAYGLGLSSEGDAYTFTFKATTTADATLVLYQEGVEVGTVALGAARAGNNTFTLTKDMLPGEGVFNWGVKLKGAAIEEAALITSCDGFYMPFGVGVNTNPESKHFGKTYLSNPWHEGKKSATGFYVFDQELNLDATLFEGGSKVGYKPSNLTLANTRWAIQRMAVSPVDGTIAFAQWEETPYIVYGMNPDDLGGAVTPLTDNTVLSQPVAVCYDKEGSLCLMNFEGKIDGKNAFSIRVIKDGEVTTFVTNNDWKSASGDNDLVSDGHGGFWVLNGKHDVSVGLLRHFTKSGEIDIDITQGTEGYPTAFRRVRIGYDLKRDVLAIGGEGKIYLYNVEYDEEGKATLTKWTETPMYNSAKSAWNTDGLAFDYAGDLCAVSASSETFYKFALPTDDNTCTTPAPKAQVIVLDEAIKQYYLTVQVNGNGEVEGTAAGLYLEGTQYELTATPAENNKFINWTLSDATSTENPLTGVLNSDLTVTANFEELAQYSITTHVDGLDMGTVEGAGMYYEGQEVTLTAKANQGYVFVKWDDETTEPTITFEATADVTRTAYFKKVATRAWAYGLQMTEGADDYTFQFTTTADGEVKILFKDKDGNELKALSLGTLKADTYTKIVSKTDFADIHKDAYWSVQIDGAEIAELAELTADNDAYRFYCPQGVVVDNNTESETFGQIYVAQPMNGSSDGMTDRTKAQERGIFLFDQTLTSLNPTDNVGVLPSNIEWAEKGRQSIHRVAINPKDKQLAMAYNIAPGAVWSVATNNVAGEATNLVAGTAITMPNSICFDEEGALYVMDNANDTTGGTIYKVVNGVAEVFGEQNTTWANIENALASDGRGGLWFLQYRGQLDGYNLLTHLNEDGEIDFAVNETTPNGFVSQSSYRGAMAYNPREDMLAIGIGPNGQIGVSLYKVTYDETTGVPTVEFFAKTSAIGANVDALGFDYAGDLYVVSAAVERFYKFVVPTEENICEVPAAKNQAIKLGAQCTVTVLVNEEAMGVVSGAGDYEVGATVTLTASAAPEHRFLRWTKDDVEVSTEEIYSFVAEENVTLVAHFEAISKYNISAGANDGAMGTVTGGGEYLEGESVELSATANPGYVFVEWNDGEKSATRTITVTEDATYTAIFQAIEARAWAYALNMEEDGEDYVFSFTATATANATLHFEYTDGTHMMSHPVGQVTAGPVSPITIAKSEFAGTKDVRWSVELDGNEITELAKLTDDSKYNGFWFAYGVGVNNNPESEYFGNIYVSNPRHSSKPNETGFYKYSPELVLDETIFEAGAKVGYKPANVTLANAVDAIQRMAVSPVDGTVAFVQWNSSAPFAAYGMNPANLAGDAVNLTEGINQPVALCYDHEGSLCVLSYDGKSEGGAVYGIHIIKNGEKTTFFSQAGWVAGGYCEIASDGQGGFYVMSGKLDAGNVVTSAKLQHISKKATIDFEVLPGGEELEDAPSTFNRLRLAYDLKHDVFALVGDKKVNLYNATYDAQTGAPTLTKWISTPEIGNTVDGVAFDYAGDLYAVSAYTETFYKFVLPTVENVCIVPAADTIIVDKPKYIRAVAEGNYGTICLPYASSSFTGATFYEVSSLVVGEGLWLDQLADGAQLVAGKPYIFQATANEITVTYTGEAVGAPVAGANGLTGTFTDIAEGGLTGNYIIAENKVWVAGSGASLPANRAYINAAQVPDKAQAQIPGRRRVIMGAEDEGTSTGFENITTTDKAVKIIENGQLIIIRDGVKYNAQGQKF